MQKIRIGISLGDTWGQEPEALLALVEDCERWDVDSFWVSDRIVAPRATLEPIVLLAYLASRLRNMKFGASALVLPTRQPVLLAKQIATLDVLSRGRLLLVVGIGGEDSRDFEAVGISRRERVKRGDEAIALMKRLWSEENVTFDGRFYSASGLTILPPPYQKGGPPLWVGGRSPAAFKRVGRLADGWLASSITPAEFAAGIEAIRAHAHEAGREIPNDHFGVLIPYCFAVDARRALEIAAPIRRREDVAVTEFAALGNPEDVRQRLRDFMSAGASKFVMRPSGPRESLRSQVETLAREVIPCLQTAFTVEERANRSGSRASE